MRMKDSGIDWVGTIPEHWKVLHVKRVLSFHNGKDYKSIEQEEGVPVFGSGGQFTYASKYIYKGESILFGRKGTIDKPMYINGEFWTVDTMFYAIPSNNAFGRYLFYEALALPLNKYSTQTALPSMTQTSLQNILICVPPISEQRTIAAYLDKKCSEIDHQVTLLTSKRDAYLRLKKSIINRAVTKGLNPNAAMKDSGVDWIGEMPEGWEVIHMKRALSFYNGRDYKSIEADEGYPVIGSGGQFAYASEYLYNGEAILFGRKGTIDKPMHINEKFWTVDTMFYATPKSNAHGRYLYYQAIVMPLNKYSTQTALPSMTQTSLQNILICCPPLSEQRAIAAYLDDKCSKIDLIVSNLDKQISKYGDLKRSLIDEVITGKRAV